MNCPSCRADNEPSAKSCFACGAPLDPALAGLADGALFASRFEILGPLGRGGMGMVYRAFDRELGETVAIKVLRPDVARESGRVEQRFRSEIRLARRVRHRNVCSVYGDGEDRGLLYICMELVEGENLARLAREGGGLSPADAWSATLQVADGLRAIHEVGVVHRDLKTANLMRDRKGVVRVMDFGIAKHHGSTTGGATVTATGTLMGTPEYMSPEQLRGDEVDFRSDLYSFGVVVLRALLGGPALPRGHARSRPSSGSCRTRRSSTCPRCPGRSGRSWPGPSPRAPRTATPTRTRCAGPSRRRATRRRRAPCPWSRAGRGTPRTTRPGRSCRADCPSARRSSGWGSPRRRSPRWPCTW